MTNISNRLKAITKFIDKQDSLVDVGCDHGLLSIYIEENHLAKKVIASDINQNALNSAISNINKRNLKIPTILSDGVKNIDLKNINTLVISGMGTSTIIHILEDKDKIKNIKKIIIQSNNDHELLRKSMNDLEYYLEQEEYTKDKNKWYITSKFVLSSKKNDDKTIKYGYLTNKEYNEYLISSYKKIYKKIPFTSFKDKIYYYKKIKDLKNYFSK